MYACVICYIHTDTTIYYMINHIHGMYYTLTHDTAYVVMHVLTHDCTLMCYVACYLCTHKSLAATTFVGYCTFAVIIFAPFALDPFFVAAFLTN